MALDKTTLGTAIASALASAHGQGITSADTTLGNAIADAVDTYVKGADVSTTVLGTLPAGPVAATGTGGLS